MFFKILILSLSLLGIPHIYSMKENTSAYNPEIENALINAVAS